MPLQLRALHLHRRQLLHPSQHPCPRTMAYIHGYACLIIGMCSQSWTALGRHEQAHWQGAGRVRTTTRQTKPGNCTRHLGFFCNSRENTLPKQKRTSKTPKCREILSATSTDMHPASVQTSATRRLPVSTSSPPQEGTPREVYTVFVHPTSRDCAFDPLSLTHCAPCL